MATVALIKLIQGFSAPPAGRSLAGVPAVQVDISNATAGVDIGSWQVDLVYVPPGSAVVIATLAFSNAPGAPVANFIPDTVPGSYRLVLKVWKDPGRVGRPTDQDIRIFAVPEPNHGFIFPPYQELPPKLPVLGSGIPGEKPDEANFGGQPYGWDGQGTEGLILDFLRTLASGGAPNFSYFVIPAAGITVPTGQEMFVDQTITGPGILTVNGLVKSPAPAATDPLLQGIVPQTGAIIGVIGRHHLVDSSAGSATVALPAAVGLLNREIEVKTYGSAGGNTITLNPNGADTIDGQLVLVMTLDREWVRLRSDGVSRWIQRG